MRGRDLALGLLLAVGWAGASLALQQAEPPLGAEPDAQQSDPEASVEAEGESSDPFEQFDIGVASLAEDDTVSEWTGLSASGLVLVPETVEVRAGQTVDSLLLERGVRPDPYARSLVAEINPNLSEAFDLADGDSLTLFQVQRPDSGPFANGRIALQPFQADRQAVRGQLHEMASLFEERSPDPQEVAPLRNRIERAEDRALLTERLQIQAAASTLSSYNSRLEALWATEAAAYERQQYAAVASYTYSAAAELRSLANEKRRASIRVRISSTGAGPSGPCEVGWAPLGFAPHKSSRVFERYQDDVVVRVPASALHVWIARSQDTPSTTALRRVQKTQLIAGDTLAMTIPTPGRCVP